MGGPPARHGHCKYHYNDTRIDSVRPSKNRPRRAYPLGCSDVVLLFTLVPGDPAQMMLGKRDDPEALAAVRAKYGLDQPLSVQYVQYLGRISPVNFREGTLFKAPDFGKKLST